MFLFQQVFNHYWNVEDKKISYRIFNDIDLWLITKTKTIETQVRKLYIRKNWLEDKNEGKTCSVVPNVHNT